MAGHLMMRVETVLRTQTVLPAQTMLRTQTMLCVSDLPPIMNTVAVEIVLSGPAKAGSSASSEASGVTRRTSMRRVASASGFLFTCQRELR